MILGWLVRGLGSAWKELVTWSLNRVKHMAESPEFPGYTPLRVRHKRVPGKPLPFLAFRLDSTDRVSFLDYPFRAENGEFGWLKIGSRLDPPVLLYAGDYVLMREHDCVIVGCYDPEDFAHTWEEIE